MNLHKKRVLTQPPTQEKGCDVMSCLPHGLKDMSGAKLKVQRQEASVAM